VRPQPDGTGPMASRSTPPRATSACVSKPLERAWLTHTEVARGGVLHLDMGAAPSGWGSTDRPYSLSR